MILKPLVIARDENEKCLIVTWQSYVDLDFTRSRIGEFTALERQIPILCGVFISSAAAPLLFSLSFSSFLIGWLFHTLHPLPYCCCCGGDLVAVVVVF